MATAQDKYLFIVDRKDYKRHLDDWQTFLRMTTATTIGVVLLLAALAVFLT